MHIQGYVGKNGQRRVRALVQKGGAEEAEEGQSGQNGQTKGEHSIQPGQCRVHCHFVSWGGIWSGADPERDPTRAAAPPSMCCAWAWK